ncbi:monocarboxylate transporter 12-like [Lineus longissimus]|uniref:monocarboxylate transporter 12-like n=1 Tax=Lineus longissimus TaxID=88925 RepID=UPI00315D0A89
MAGKQSLGQPNSYHCDHETSVESFRHSEKISFENDDVSHQIDDEISSCDSRKQSFLSNCRRDFWGYQSVILFSSFMCYFIFCGVCYTVSLYYVAWMDEFEAGSAITSWLGSVHIGIITLVAPVSSFLTDRFGFRPVIIAGGLVSTGGLLATVFVNSIYSLFITFSIITPIGFGLVYVPSSTIVSLYFDRGRVIANGLVTSGAGFGNFVMAYVLHAGIEALNWRGSMFISAGLGLQLCVLGALMREPKSWTELKRQQKLKSNVSRSVTVMSGFHLYKRNGMALFFIHMLLVSAGLSIVFVHVTAITESLGGVTRAKAILAISLIGLSTIIGRIASGCIGQHKNVDTFLYYILSLTLSGLSAILVPFLSFYSVILTWTVVFSLLVAPSAGLMQIIILHFIGLADLNMAFAHTGSFLAVGYIVGAPVAGWLFDFTQDYSSSFFLGGSFITVGSLLLVIPYMRHRKDAKISAVELDDNLKATSIFGSIVGSQYLDAVRSHNELRQSGLVLRFDPGDSESNANGADGRDERPDS